MGRKYPSPGSKIFAISNHTCLIDLFSSLHRIEIYTSFTSILWLEDLAVRIASIFLPFLYQWLQAYTETESIEPKIKIFYYNHVLQNTYLLILGKCQFFIIIKESSKSGAWFKIITEILNFTTIEALDDNLTLNFTFSAFFFIFTLFASFLLAFKRKSWNRNIIVFDVHFTGYVLQFF